MSLWDQWPGVKALVTAAVVCVAMTGHAWPTGVRRCLGLVETTLSRELLAGTLAPTGHDHTGKGRCGRTGRDRSLLGTGRNRSLADKLAPDSDTGHDRCGQTGWGH